MVRARGLVVVATLVAVASAARADQSTAQAAYTQAEDLAKQGKWADACPLYEASFKADPQLGALVHLADCHERIGKTATAWGEWNDAAALAHSRTDDKREALARARAAALAPKLAKLHLSPPKQLIPGLVVKRDGADITILVGTDIPTDPGEHELTASAAGYVDWKSKVVIAAASATSVDIPVLDRQVEVVPPPVVHEGSVKITTLPDAQILIDSNVVGKGSFEGKLPSGGHTLRVVAGGMRPYQSELIVTDNQNRIVDVPLEKEVAAVVIVPAGPKEDLPSFELGATFLAGKKLRRDNPSEIIYRFDAAFRFGHRVNFGLFVELASIDTGNTCGFDMPGPVPSTPYDFGPRNQMKRCTSVEPGLQLLIHTMPKRRIDPYFGLAPGFKFGFISWIPYIGASAQDPTSQVFLAIMSNVIAGVDYHPKPGGWEVGGYVDAAITLVGDEQPDTMHSDNKPSSSLALLLGLRTSVAF